MRRILASAPGPPRSRLEPLRPERVAKVGAPVLEPAAEPAHALIGRAVRPRLGPHRGTKRWQHLGQEVRVPLATREAIVRIGLFGGVGTARFDNVTIRATK